VKFAAAFALLCLWTSCKETRGPIDDVWVEIPNTHATHFQIMEKGGDRILFVFGPGGRTDTLEAFHIGRSALERIAVGSTTHLPYIGALGKIDVVKGAASIDEIKDNSYRDAIDAGRIKDISTANGLDKELLVSLSPQLILDHPFGKTIADEISGIEVLHITEYLEEHPLGRAEWIRAFGVLLGEERFADSLFQQIQQRYDSAKGMLPDTIRRPVAFFGSNWQGTWFAPPAGSYMSILIHDAGAAYALADRTASGNITLSLEEVYDQLDRCDHFGMILTHDGEVDALKLVGGERRLVDMPAVQNGGFHGNSADADLFGGALLEPDVVLLDLMSIFHPKTLTSHQPKYFKPLLKADQRTMPR
jgi:iron complex transport system substrate-binding protein